MTNISISQLKINPARAINKASNEPVAIQKRNETKAYLIGTELYHALVTYIEDRIDKKAVKSADFTKGRDFEDVAEELGI